MYIIEEIRHASPKSGGKKDNGYVKLALTLTEVMESKNMLQHGVQNSK